MTAGRGTLSLAQATIRVLKSVGAHSKNRDMLRNESGTIPLIVALPYEHFSDVYGRVRAAGGRANVAVAYVKKYQMLRLGGGHASGPEIVISEDLSMGMLSIKLKALGGQAVRFRFGDVDAEMPAPAAEITYA